MNMAAEKIDLAPVESSVFSAIGHNPHKQILALKFRSGAIHHYAGVSAEKFMDFASAESLGSHFTRHIKNQHQAEKMTGTCPNCGARHGWLNETCDDCGTATFQSEERK